MNGATSLFGPAPWGAGEVSKGQKKYISKIFIPNFVRVITNDIISFCHLGQKLNYVRLSVMLSPPKSFDEIQLNFVCEFHEWGVQQHVFGLAPWGPGEGSKGQISLYFNHKVNLTNKRYKTY